MGTVASLSSPTGRITASGIVMCRPNTTPAAATPYSAGTRRMPLSARGTLRRPVSAQSAPLKPIAPIEPIAAVVDAFRSHDVIGLQAGESHGDERGPAFVISVMRDPRFAAVGVDVVMENGSARYQGVIDRYTRGEEVPYSELRHVWDGKP